MQSHKSPRKRISLAQIHHALICNCHCGITEDAQFRTFPLNIDHTVSSIVFLSFDILLCIFFVLFQFVSIFYYLCRSIFKTWKFPISSIQLLWLLLLCLPGKRNCARRQNMRILFAFISTVEHSNVWNGIAPNVPFCSRYTIISCAMKIYDQTKRIRNLYTNSVHMHTHIIGSNFPYFLLCRRRATMDRLIVWYIQFRWNQKEFGILRFSTGYMVSTKGVRS